MLTPDNEQRDTLDRSPTQGPKTAKRSDGSLPQAFGRYRVLKRIGSGAMGDVYLAEDTHLRRRVAIKTPRFAADPSGEFLRRFYREAQCAASLHHPNICPVFDVGKINGHHFIAMAFVEGHTLSRFTEVERLLPERKIFSLMRKLALAMQEAHKHSVVHRDLKPSNVIINSKGEPIVMDFGLAARFDLESQTRLTQTGTVIGTIAYMSPEQLEGERAHVGPPTDQYALGAIFYELLTGQLPFQGSIARVIGQIMTKNPMPPGRLCPGLDPRAQAICLRMLSKQSHDRFPDLRHVANELTDILRGDGSSAKESAPPRLSIEGQKPSQSHDHNVHAGRLAPIGKNMRPVSPAIVPAPLRSEYDIRRLFLCARCLGFKSSSKTELCDNCAKTVRPVPRNASEVDHCPRCKRFKEPDCDYCDYCAD